MHSRSRVSSDGCEHLRLCQLGFVAKSLFMLLDLALAKQAQTRQLASTDCIRIIQKKRHHDGGEVAGMGDSWFIVQ